MSNSLLEYKLFGQYTGLVGFTTTRSGGVSEGEKYSSFNLGTYTNDIPSNVVANKHILCSLLGIGPSRLFNAHQTHGDRIVCVDENVLSLSTEEVACLLEGCDALVTSLKGVCVTVTTADCVPVLLYDKKNKVIAAVHSGWRGTLLDISVKAVKVMSDKYNTDPLDIVAVVGPCISQSNYQVDNDLRNKFLSSNPVFESYFTADTVNKDKCYMDIRGIVERELLDSGVSDIYVSELCTYEDNNLFFSARRQGNDSGRMLSGLLMKS